VQIDEFGVTFEVDLGEGQKTGHFFDQAENRLAAAPWCRGRSVLDVYCNTGGFGLHALAAGAERAVFVEKSAPTAERVLRNLSLNGFKEKGEVIQVEATRVLESFVAEGRRFGAVVLDPPAFAKSRKTAGNALRGYTRINALGMTLVEPGGFLFTSSCSYHIQEDRFLEAIAQAAKLAGRRLRLIRRGEQGPDHPMLPEVPESRYLKSLAFQVLL
jgi:23S rRNA (cytosine1962-C5)-methyltransferase